MQQVTQDLGGLRGGVGSGDDELLGCSGQYMCQALASKASETGTAIGSGSGQRCDTVLIRV